MERLDIMFNNELFNRLVHGSEIQASGITIVIKENGTVEGSPIAVIAFDALIDGKIRSVQATTTLKLVKSALEIIAFRYAEGDSHAIS